MSWQPLESEIALAALIEASHQKPALIFKHSTRCSISSTAWSRMERASGLEERFSLYYLDLLQYRSVSNAIAERLQVEHESPQLILVSGGKAVFHASHLEIRPEFIPA